MSLRFPLLVVGVGLLAGGLTWWFSQSDDSAKQAPQSDPASPTADQAVSGADDSNPTARAASARAEPEPVVAGPTVVPTGGSFTSRSAMTPAQPFDLAAYQADPEAYLSQVVPARVWQALPPADGVVVASAVGLDTFAVPPEGSATFQVQAIPAAPVTFLATDLAHFQNGKQSITVAADEQGIATTTWHALPGTVGDAHVIASSPLTSGQVSFFVNVPIPTPASVERSE